MVTVTDLVLAQAVFGHPRKLGEQDFSSSVADGIQGAMPSPAWRQPHSDAKRAALIDMLKNGGDSEPHGVVVAPAAGSPTVTSDRPQRPFSEDYPPSYFLPPLPWRYLWGAPTDFRGRLRYDSERRELEAKYVAGRRYANGPDVGLQYPEVLDVMKQLGHAPAFLPTNRMPNPFGKGRPPAGVTDVGENTWPRTWFEGRIRLGQVSIDDNLDPRDKSIVASHELGHPSFSDGAIVER